MKHAEEAKARIVVLEADISHLRTHIRTGMTHSDDHKELVRLTKVNKKLEAEVDRMSGELAAMEMQRDILENRHE